MEAGIADTINRRDACLIAARMDAMDLPEYGGGAWHRRFCGPGEPWFSSVVADTLTSHSDASRSDRVWLIAGLAAGIPELHFDGSPADCDWDNLFSHIRAEILARRDPEAHAHPVHAAEVPVRDGVGSR